MKNSLSLGFGVPRDELDARHPLLLRLRDSIGFRVWGFAHPTVASPTSQYTLLNNSKSLNTLKSVL